MIFLSFLCNPLTTIPYWAIVQEVNSSEQDKASCPAVGFFFYALFRQRKKHHSFSVVSGLYSSRSPGCISSILQKASIFSHDTGLPSLSFCKVDWLNSFSFLIRYVEYPLSLRACRTLILNTIPTVLTSLSIVYNHCTTEYERIQVYILNKASKKYDRKFVQVVYWIWTSYRL